LAFEIVPAFEVMAIEEQLPAVSLFLLRQRIDLRVISRRICAAAIGSRASGGTFVSRKLCRNTRFPFISQFLHRMARLLLPDVLAVFTLADRRVQLRRNLFVVFLAHPVEKIRADAITAVISRSKVS